MTFRELARVLREQWLIVIGVVVLGLGASATFYVIRPPLYTASLTMYVSSQQGDTAQQAYQGAQLSQQRVKSYVELINSRRVSEDVIRRLGLDETPEELTKQITASSALDSVLIDVSVVDRSPDQAARLANGVGAVFTDLVNELERPTQPGVQQAVAVRVVQPAETPDRPSSTGLAVTLAAGLLVGLALGTAAALARSAMDVSIKSAEQLRELVGAPNLGRIVFSSVVPKHPLTVHEDPQSPRAEAFRQLRTNLQFVEIDTPPKTIVVTSSLPSEGKTTTIVNLAIAMAYAGGRVLVIEADLRRPKVSELLGLERTVGLTTVLSGRVPLEQAIQTWGDRAFDVLASGPLPPNPSELLASKQMAGMLTELRRHYDTILIDTPPLLPVTDAAAVVPATDGAILICRYKKTSRIQLTAAAEALRNVSATLLGTVFSMVPSGGPHAYAQYNSYYRAEDAAAATPARSVRRQPSALQRHGTAPTRPPRPRPRPLPVHE